MATFNQLLLGEVSKLGYPIPQAALDELVLKGVGKPSGYDAQGEKAAEQLFRKYVTLLGGKPTKHKAVEFWSRGSKEDDVDLSMLVYYSGNPLMFGVYRGLIPIRRAQDRPLDWRVGVTSEAIERALDEARQGNLKLLKVAAKSFKHKTADQRALELWDTVGALDAMFITQALASQVKTSPLARAWFNLGWFTNDIGMWGRADYLIIQANGEWLDLEGKPARGRPYCLVGAHETMYGNYLQSAQRVMADYELMPVFSNDVGHYSHVNTVMFRDLFLNGFEKYLGW